MSYVYIMSETAAETGGYPLYTVGHYSPEGRWIPESDHGGESGKESAAARVAQLNGKSGGTAGFSLLVTAELPNEQRQVMTVEALVDFGFDLVKLAEWLGRAAILNKTGRSQVQYGALVAEVRNGTRRTVQATKKSA